MCTLDLDFIANLKEPIDLKTGNNGELFIADYGTSCIYRVVYPSPPQSLDTD